MQKIHLALATSAALILAACGGSGSSSHTASTPVTKPTLPTTQPTTQPAKPTPAQERAKLAAANTVSATPEQASQAFTALESFSLANVTTTEQAKAKLENFTETSFKALAKSDEISLNRLPTDYADLATAPQVTKLAKANRVTLANSHGDGADAFRLLQATDPSLRTESSRTVGDSADTGNNATQPQNLQSDQVEPTEQPTPPFSEYQQYDQVVTPLSRLNGEGVEVAVVGHDIAPLTQEQQQKLAQGVAEPVAAATTLDNQYADVVLAAAQKPTALKSGQKLDSGLAYQSHYRGFKITGDNVEQALTSATNAGIINLRLKDLRLEGEELTKAIQALEDPAVAERDKATSYVASLAAALHQQARQNPPLIIVDLPVGDFLNADKSTLKANDLVGLLAASKHADRLLFVTTSNLQHGQLLKGCGVAANQCLTLSTKDDANNASGSVVAIAALVKQRYPWMTAQQVRDTILTTTKRSEKFNSVTGWQAPDAVAAVGGPRAILGNTTWDLTRGQRPDSTSREDSPDLQVTAFYHSINGDGKLTVRGNQNTQALFLGSVLPSQGLVLESGNFTFNSQKAEAGVDREINDSVKDQQKIFAPSNFTTVLSKAYQSTYNSTGVPWLDKYLPSLNSALTVPAEKIFNNFYNRITVGKEGSVAKASFYEGHYDEIQVKSGAKVFFVRHGAFSAPVAVDNLTLEANADVQVSGFVHKSNEDLSLFVGVVTASYVDLYKQIKDDPVKRNKWVDLVFNGLNKIFGNVLDNARVDKSPAAEQMSRWERWKSQDSGEVVDVEKVNQYIKAIKETTPDFFDDEFTRLKVDVDRASESMNEHQVPQYTAEDEKFALRVMSLAVQKAYIKDFNQLMSDYQQYTNRGRLKDTAFETTGVVTKAKQVNSLKKLSTADLLSLNFGAGQGLLIKNLHANGNLYAGTGASSGRKVLFGYVNREGEFQNVYGTSPEPGTIEHDDANGVYYLQPISEDSSRSLTADNLKQRNLVKRGLDSLESPAPEGWHRLYSTEQLENVDLTSVAADKSLLIDSANVATTLLSSDLEVAQAANPNQSGSSASTATTNNVVLSDKLTKENNPVRALAGETKPTGVTVNTVTEGTNGAAPTVTPTTFSLNDKDVYLQARKALADYSDLELGTFLYRASAAAYSASHLAVSQQTRVLNSDFLVQAGQFKQAVSAADLAGSASGASGLKLNTYAQYAFKRADWTQEASQVVGKWNHHNFAVGVYGQLDLNQAVNASSSSTGSLGSTSGNLGAVNLGLAATHLTGTWLEALDAKFDKSVLSENQVSSTSLVVTAGYAWNKAFLNLGAAYSYQGFNSQRSLFTERDLTAEYARHEASLSALAGAQLVGDQLVGLQARARVTATYSYQGEFGEKLNSEPKATDAAKALALTAKSASAWELVGNLGVVGTYKFVTNGLTQGLDASVDVSLRALNADYAVKGETLVNKAAKTEFTSGATFKPTYLVRAQAGYSYEFVPGLNVRVGAGYSKTTNWGAFEGDVKLTYSF